MGLAIRERSPLSGASEVSGEGLKPQMDIQERLEALSSLIKMSTAIGSTAMDLKDSLRFLIKETKRLFDAYSCAIFLLDGDGDSSLIFSGPPEMQRRLPRFFKTAKSCLVVRDELPFISQDTSEKDRRCRGFSFHKKVGSYVCMPISTGKKLLGVLCISSSRPRAFSHDHLEMILSISTLVASVIQQARLFEKVEEEKRSQEQANKEINKLNSDLRAKIEELKEAQEQIIQAEKLAVAGRLAAGIAHEVNNPIGIITNRIECLQLEAQEKGLSDDLMKDLQTIGKYAHRISRIVEDLSILSRTTYSESEFGRVEINDVLEDVLFLVEQKIKGKKIELIKDLSPRKLFILGDLGRLEQVFVNLLDNAIHAVSGQGTISVSIRFDTPEEKNVQIDIYDSGMGIQEENLGKIYDPFFTTKEVGKGTGLGLPICYAIIKDHNGSIKVNSKIDEGTTFTINFPRVPEAGEAN
jgi:C4-dicarboxylate-specific signal transduction histidine kinase